MSLDMEVTGAQTGGRKPVKHCDHCGQEIELIHGHEEYVELHVKSSRWWFHIEDCLNEWMTTVFHPLRQQGKDPAFYRRTL